MNFMSTSSSSSSSSFHYLTTTATAAPPQNNNHHHHHSSGRTPSASDDAGEDNEDLVGTTTTTMRLFARPSEPQDNTTPAAVLIEKEHMFDKVVTPSDVGKLNRLVIPKQYAEKYFPLDSSTNEKGLLLNFEDRNGKPWRFRYSYWNSSQSYVMTKGWSRFVKEKKLDAGDVVSFQRGSGELGKDRLFIDWRRRPDAPDLMIPPPHLQFPYHHHPQFSYHHRGFNPWISANGGSNNPPVFLQPRHHDYGNNSTNLSPPYGYNGGAIVNGNPCPPGSILYLRSGAGNEGAGFYGGPHHQQRTTGGHSNNGGGGSCHELQHHQQVVFDSVPVVQGKAAAKRLRLFGVNMDCPMPDDDHHHVLSSTGNLGARPTMPMFRSNFGGFDSSLLPSSSSSTVPSPNYRSYEEEVAEDKGKGTSMSLDLDI